MCTKESFVFRFMDPPFLKTEQTLELTFEIFRFHEFWDFVAQKTKNFFIQQTFLAAILKLLHWQHMVTAMFGLSLVQKLAVISNWLRFIKSPNLSKPLK